jgi:multiple antibiotic resistance protein
MWSLFLQTILLVPLTLLPIINPLVVAPVFANMVEHVDEKGERRLARQITIYCWFLLIGSILIGSHALSFFGISLPIVRIAGGLVVGFAGWKMLDGGEFDVIRIPEADNNQGNSHEELKVRGFYPICFPLTIGPGSIASAIALGASLPTRPLDWVVSVGSAVVGTFFTVLVIYFCYRYAKQLVNKLGRLGTIVTMRLSAFILVCIGLEIFWKGVLGTLMESGILK